MSRTIPRSSGSVSSLTASGCVTPSMRITLPPSTIPIASEFATQIVNTAII
jgi:hypothetical protein